MCDIKVWRYSSKYEKQWIYENAFKTGRSARIQNTHTQYFHPKGTA